MFVRDWLSANHVLLKSRDGHVLIDSGYVRHAPLTLALLDSAARARRRAAGQARQHALPLRPHRRQRGGRAQVRLPDRRARRARRRRSRRGTSGRCCSTTRTSAPTASPPTRSFRPARRTSGATSSGSALAAPGPRHGRAGVLQPRAPDPDLRRRAVGARLRLRDAARDRPGRAAGDARDARHASPALDVRVVIPGHGEPFTDVGGGAGARLRAPRRVRGRLRPRRAARRQGAADVHAARRAADVADRAARSTSPTSASTATSTRRCSGCRRPTWPR